MTLIRLTFGTYLIGIRAPEGGVHDRVSSTILTYLGAAAEPSPRIPVATYQVRIFRRRRAWEFVVTGPFLVYGAKIPPSLVEKETSHLIVPQTS